MQIELLVFNEALEDFELMRVNVSDIARMEEGLVWDSSNPAPQSLLWRRRGFFKETGHQLTLTTITTFTGNYMYAPEFIERIAEAVENAKQQNSVVEVI